LFAVIALKFGFHKKSIRGCSKALLAANCAEKLLQIESLTAFCLYMVQPNVTAEFRSHIGGAAVSAAKVIASEYKGLD
jgi:hypothetical protein